MRILLMFCMIAVLAACSNVTKEDLGLSKRSPDERAVEQRRPLSLPPEFDVRPATGVNVRQN